METNEEKSNKKDDLLKRTKSAGGVVLNKDGKVIVVEQKGSGTTWSLPKGHIEEKEDELEAARREIYEEAGIKNLKFIKKLGSYKRNSLGKDTSEFKTIVMFLFKTAEHKLKPIDVKNPNARWIDKNQVASLLTHPKDKKFFLQVKKKIKKCYGD